MEILKELYFGLLNMGWLEGLGVSFGILYIYFAAKEMIWCWYASLVSVSIYLVICYQVQLYAEMGLNFYYLGTTIYGWWHWRNPNRKEKELPISKMKLKEHGIFIIAGILFTFGLGYFLIEKTDAQLPYLDSFTTVFSVLTTLLVTRKVLENWLYWIVIDTVAVYIYFQRELFLTSLLMAAYVIIAAVGYFNWRRLYQTKYA
ncbi:nicotinamide mononucleotide transporter [Marivirga tractuosa]|uniref:Nicotinamide riboside transporter PnuC n=1 Tax=Marivirga tractuosa (strain ATCC 23168 / DSM 4126 / NBRC 15989 / NCIMB 1408 / VKM B-1430 / H-43) TaxID=643867 RepID=E4TL00_MARTH|nr:nicotinamide riboside transporter PnuC [Marivirga tractuosa]ADR23277.1 nicotinamide mononucleotide transporter PnuC [Marivirga tractuosa DSM 4126]BDD16049.1 nicotinamide mononucleotide transporter [Marivirga tractuosa]